jgi:hypothetical protein
MIHKFINYYIQGSDIGIAIMRANQSSDINVNELSMNLYIYIKVGCTQCQKLRIAGWLESHPFMFFFGDGLK